MNPGRGPDERRTRDVPPYDVLSSGERANDYCVAIFVLNERERLLSQLTKMAAYRHELDIIVADGGSTDGTADQEALPAAGVDTLLRIDGPPGLGRQMRMAFDWCLRAGYAGVICMDGNDKDGPEALPSFIAALRDGYDFVQGSRFIKGGISENLPAFRHLGIRLVHAPLLSLASRFRYTDTTNGFRAFSAELLADERTAVFRDVFEGYELHYYLAVRAAQLGYRVREIPVARRYPKTGPTPTKITPVRGNLQVLRCLVKASVHAYDPEKARS